MSPHAPEASRIHSMFGEIAGRYDLANDIMSLGIHHLWRKALVRWSGAREGQSVLDCATGTGDLAIELKRAVGETGSVTGTDFSAEMMVTAPAKAAKQGLKIDFETADVMHLPYDGARFDLASISFGIRNVEDPMRGLCELARVVKPGGVVMILEFGQPRIPVLDKLYAFYSRFLLPRIGGLITGKPQAYRYLQTSSAKFPCRENFVALMLSTGRFSSCEFRPVSLGIAYLYKGVVR